MSGLLVGVSTRDTARILSSLFDNNGQITGPTVHSLGLDPHRFGRTVTRVATVTFAQTREPSIPDINNGTSRLTLEPTGRTMLPCFPS